jgi:trans-L-3-hydroxyproline dehydratase
MSVSIKTTDMHTGGEPLRIITGGLPEIPGKTVLERRRYFRENLDHLRTGMMWEPRGHADMYGAILTPPDTADADFGVFFLHNEGYSTMCGHAVIALARFATESGLVDRMGETVEMSIDVPAGRLRASAYYNNGQYKGSSFLNVPSFLYLQSGEIELEGHGTLKFDIAYGGAFYAFVEACAFNLELTPGNSRHFIDLGRRIKKAVMDKYPVIHPFEPDLGFLYGTIFTGPPSDPSHHSRNICIFADGELDRSATGSGVSARAAMHHAKGEINIGEKITIESILGSTMDVEVAETCTFGPYPAVIPKVSGEAWFTGRHEFIFEDNDPLLKGFFIR